MSTLYAVVFGALGLALGAAFIWVYASLRARSAERERAWREADAARSRAQQAGRAVERQHVDAAAQIDAEFARIESNFLRSTEQAHAPQPAHAPNGADPSADPGSDSDAARELWNRANAAVDAAARGVDPAVRRAAPAGGDEHAGDAGQSHRGDAPVRAVRAPPG